MTPSFSIIIPSFNRSGALVRAIESVIAQVSENWELIIINDGSTDNTEEVVNNYLKDPRIQYYYQEHSGVSSARNQGIEKSRADYIIFLDSDDKFHPDLISALEASNFKEFDLIFWYIKKIYGRKISISKPRKLERIYNSITASFLSGSVCYRKDILLEVGGYDEAISFGENYEMGMRITQLENLKLYTLPKIYHYYNIPTSNRQSALPERKLDSLKYLLQKHKEIYKKDQLSYSRLLYQIGYLNEKLGRNTMAIEFYRKASRVRPLFWKPFVKQFLFLFK